MKYLLFICFSLALLTESEAQLLKKAKNKLLGKKEQANSSEPKNFVNIAELVQKWEDGEYDYRYGDNVNGLLSNGKKNVKFIKDDEGTVIKVETNLNCEDYKLHDEAGIEAALSYGCKNYMLYVTDESLVFYRFGNYDRIEFPYVLGKKINKKQMSKEIMAYRDWAKSVNKVSKAEYAANQDSIRKVKAAERLGKYGLADKKVKSIEIVNLKVPEKFGHFRSFNYGLKATLKDGTEIPTGGYNTKGYRSDYTVSYSPSNYNGGDVKSGFIEGDKITIKAKLKYDPSITAEKDVVLKYNEDITFGYSNGKTSNFGNGGHANTYRFEVKQVKHAVTGKDILKIRIINVTDGSKIKSEFKMGVDQSLHFYCNGGKGGKSNDQWGIGNGGNGGNIIVVKDPSVKYFNFDYHNNGGAAGPNYSARRGRDGSYKEEVRAVNF